MSIIPRKIKKERAWGEDKTLDPRWKSNGRLARHRPYFFYENADLVPCDAQGYRVPSGYESISKKYAENIDNQTVFCYGGSTTFGVYCSYIESYPHSLETITGKASFNMGLQTFDLYGSLLSFLDHLRDGLVPKTAIFLDGVNENQGFLQSVIENRENYVAEFRQYSGFRDIILNGSFKHRFRNFFTLANPDVTEERDPCRFVREQALFYCRSQNIIVNIGKAYGVRTVFFLQPSVWDFWDDGSEDLRYTYLKSLYNQIMALTKDVVIDISTDVSLAPEYFYDWAHLSAEGNRQLAEMIAERVF